MTLDTKLKDRPTILAISPLEGGDDWNAIDKAALLARRWKGRLVVLKSKDGRQLSEAERRALKDEIESHIATQGPSWSAEVVSGAAYSNGAILEAAKQFSPDLVVMAPSVVWALGTLVDSAPEVVAAGTRCPVLVTKVGTDVYGGGLMGTDLSQACAEAIGQVERLGLLPVERLTVLYAYSPLSETMVAFAGVDPREIDRVGVAAESRARDELLAFIDRCGLNGKVKIRTSKAPPAAAILTEADDQAADLIILGSSRRGSLARFLMGSTVRGVLAGARCDVLVAPGFGRAED